MLVSHGKSLGRGTTVVSSYVWRAITVPPALPEEYREVEQQSIFAIISAVAGRHLATANILVAEAVHPFTCCARILEVQ